ncbi:hypothetical protein cypCar_00011828 [Cyprinus carpio]|nr:hypothetical protein cypCar_00011828 [Cyprinus carpio]
MVKSKQTNLEGKKADYSFNEHSVRGPVLCACVDDKWLYYSSLNDLHALQLTTASSSSEETGIESQLQALTSDSLGVCRVIALAGPYTNSTGQRVKDLLASIANIWASPEASSLGVSQLLTETGSISAPLSTLTVDWLDALRLEGSFSHGNIRHNTVTDGIQAFLHSRGVLTKDSDTTTKSGPITVMVILEDFCSDGPLEVLEIRVESTSVAAVCGLHHAILRRLQVLFRDSALKCGHTKQLKAQSLFEAVRHVESLFKDLQDAQNQAALSGTMKMKKNSEILFRIFLQLRANPLVIL